MAGDSGDDNENEEGCNDVLLTMGVNPVVDIGTSIESSSDSDSSSSTSALPVSSAKLPTARPLPLLLIT